MNDLRRLLCLCAFILLFPLAAGAQTATLVRDINQGYSSFPELAVGYGLASVPGRVFFTARSGSGNVEVAASDGTAEGTFLLKDVCTGPCATEIRVLGSLNGVLFWAGRSDDNSFYLWRSDGTRSGTYQLVEERIRFNGEDSFDQNPPPASSVAGGFFYFVTSTDDREALWRTDGTRAGTRLVRTLEGEQFVDTLLADAGKVYLIVRQYVSGSWTWSVWTSDGTAGGTRSIKTIDVFGLESPRVAGGHLFFTTTSNAEGDELWASDGTAAGTRPVTEFVPRSPFGVLGSFRPEVSGGHLFFVADDVVHGRELYESDGTVAGTRRITDFGTADPFFGPVADLGSRIVFTADDALGHFGVWSTAGDPSSTRFLPLPCDDCFENVRGFVKVGSRVVLFGFSEVLSTDGTPAGTRSLLAGCPNGCHVVPPEHLPAEASAVPFATDAPETLWITDGTPAGTRKRITPRGESFSTSGYDEISAGSFTMVFGGYRFEKALWALDRGSSDLRLVMAPGVNGPDSRLDNLTAFQSSLAFTVCDGNLRTLWRSAGMEQSTAPAAELSVCPSTLEPSDMASLGTTLVLLVKGDFSHRMELWRSDGTPGGTQRLSPADLEILGRLIVGTSRVYFSAKRDLTVSVWTSDGTPAGTVQLASWPGNNPPYSLTAVGNELYFYFGSFEPQVWKSDGTPQGTKKVFDHGGASNIPGSFTRVGSLVYFVSFGSGFDEEVWRTDGTAAGTRPLGTVAGMNRDSSPGELIAFQGNLYFFAWTESDQIRGLWRSDGTAAGTVLLAQFPEPGHPGYPGTHQLAINGGKLFFVAGDGIDPDQHGTELWVTDGTPAGTRMVRDVRPGIGDSKPDHLTAAGGRLFFTAVEETYGRELWVSDGTEAGTRLVQDIAPFGASSEPDRLTAAGDRLYFTADDGVSGRELWSLPLSGPAGCQTSSTRLCLNGGRYQVEASWRTDDLAGHATAVSLSGDTGYFWFFSPSNVEAVVKVLDGRGVDGHVWVFYGALSNVDYTITVTDTQTGATRRYHNPMGQLASVGDTKGFGPLGAYSTAPPVFEAPASPLPLVAERFDRTAAVPCQASAQRLCLNGNRFAVEVAWKDFDNHTGKGTAAPLTTDTGTFWFFNSANVELVVKVLDGRPVNNKFWLFYGALSNVEYTVTVTDTETGAVRTYRNPSGRFASVADTTAF